MEAPLPAQPHTAASVATKHTRRRTSKKKASGDFMHQHAAEDWIRALASRGVKLTPSLYRLLFELAQWCGPAYGFEVRPWVYDPVDDDGNPLLDDDGNPQLGILSRLGISYHAYLLHMGRLQRICEHCRTMHFERKECGQDGLISKTVQGRGNRIRRRGDGGQKKSLPSAYRLNVRPLATTLQEPLFRTETHGPTGSPMSKAHGPTGSPMSKAHGPTGSPMSKAHGPTGSPMSKTHGPTGRPLLDTSNRSHTSKLERPPTSPSTACDSSGGEDGGGFFCSHFLIPAFEDVGLTGFTEASLNFVEYAVPRFAEIHGRQPDKSVADHMAERLVKFIRQEGIDISVEPHRILSERGGYLRNVLVPSVLEAGMALRFEPVDSVPELEPETPADTAAPADVPFSPKAQEIWRKALEELREQVARPAFETWLSDTVGVSHEAGVFVVGTANDFISEMLRARMYPLIERAVEHVVDEAVEVHFQVVAKERGPE